MAAQVDSTGNGMWQWTKHIPIVISVCIQTGAALWWASSINERVHVLERQTLAAITLNEKTIRLETQMDLVLRTLADVQTDIKSILRK